MLQQPYQPGTISRTGAPWSGVSGAPFISVARKAPAASSSPRRKIQLAPSSDVIDGPEWSSKPEIRIAVADGLGAIRSITFVKGTPDQGAALIRPNADLVPLPEHSIRWTPCGTTWGSSSSSGIVTFVFTRPATEID